MSEAGLQNAIINRNTRVLKFILASGVHDLDADEGDLLRLAVILRNEEAVEVLVKKGANVHFREDEVLVFAVKNNDERIVKALLLGGADPMAQNGICLQTADKKSRIYQMLMQAVQKNKPQNKPPKKAP